MKRIRILCYGDSNTWGYISGSDHQRYEADERWTGVLSNLLGDRFEIIEEGLNSRTLTSVDTRPGKEGRNGSEYLIPCLDTHDPIDIVVLMLGTNELKNAYRKSAEQIGMMLEEHFVKTILSRKSQCRDGYPRLLIVAPPLVSEGGDHGKAGKIYAGAEEKSKGLNEIYQKIAERNRCGFLSNEGMETGPDGVHLTRESHKKLAEKLCEKLTAMQKSSVL